MKKLKLTINDEVKTFDLPENEEYKVEVVNKYVPKVGDCVMERGDVLGCATFFKIVSIDYSGNIKAKYCVDLHKGKCTIDLDYFWFSYETKFTQITPEELKAKYAEAGYDWDYESDTIKPLKWTPKKGDVVWAMNGLLEPYNFIYNTVNTYILKLEERVLLFQTEEKCQQFADHCMLYINNKKE